MTHSSPQVEYGVDAAGNIDLYVDGELARVMGQPDVRRVRTKKRQEATLEALDDARRLGYLHGTCDRMAEIAATMRGDFTPGCASYSPVSEPVSDGRTSHGVMRRLDGNESVVLDGLTGAGQASEAARALHRAFQVGSRYGWQLVHRVKVVRTTERVTNRSSNGAHERRFDRHFWWVRCPCGLHKCTDSRPRALQIKAEHEVDRSASPSPLPGR